MDALIESTEAELTNLDSVAVSFGGTIKSLGMTADGALKYEARLVTFGSDEDPLGSHDATPQRDYFTKDTDFDIESGDKTTVYYHHGLNPTLKARKLGTATLEIKDDGVWMQGELACRDAYEKRIQQMIEAGKLGASSGVPSHLTKRTAIKTERGTAHRIDLWPLGKDASLTPCPADYRCGASSLKSLVESVEDELSEEPQAIKSQYLGEYLENDMTMAALRALNDSLMWRVVSGALSPSIYPVDDLGFTRNAPIPADERLAKVRAAFQEFQDIALRLIGQAMAKGETAESAAKAINDLYNPNETKSHNFTSPDEVVTAVTDILRASMPLDWHLESARAAVKSTQERIAAIIDKRCLNADGMKSGRVLSADNHATFCQWCDSLESIAAEMREKLEAHAPQASAGNDEAATKAIMDEVDAIELAWLQAESRRFGVAV